MQGQCPGLLQPQFSHSPSVATPLGLAWREVCCWVYRRPRSFGRAGSAVSLSHGVMSRPGSFLRPILPPSRFSHLFDNTGCPRVAKPHNSWQRGFHGLQGIAHFLPILAQISPLPCFIYIISPLPTFHPLPYFTLAHVSTSPRFHPFPNFTFSHVSPSPRFHPFPDSLLIQVPHHPRPYPRSGCLPHQTQSLLRVPRRPGFHAPRSERPQTRSLPRKLVLVFPGRTASLDCRGRLISSFTLPRRVGVGCLRVLMEWAEWMWRVALSLANTSEKYTRYTVAK